MKFVRFGVPAAALAAALAFGSAAQADTFDGNWAVTVFSKSGTCDSGFLLPIKVTAGQITYAGKVKTNATGAIGKDGVVKARFMHGSDVVDANGRVSGTEGGGSWTSPTMKCSGSWQASKN
jgi:hypothetical protein